MCLHTRQILGGAVTLAPRIQGPVGQKWRGLELRGNSHSKVKGARAKPGRIVGVMPSSPTNTKLFTLRNIAGYFSSIRGL